MVIKKWAFALMNREFKVAVNAATMKAGTLMLTSHPTQNSSIGDVTQE